MWISKAHFDLIRERAADFRAWHNEQMAVMREQIQALEARNRTLETERQALTERLWTRQIEREKPPEAMPEPESSWESLMRQQIDELGKDSANE